MKYYSHNQEPGEDQELKDESCEGDFDPSPLHLTARGDLHPDAAHLHDKAEHVGNDKEFGENCGANRGEVASFERPDHTSKCHVDCRSEEDRRDENEDGLQTKRSESCGLAVRHNSSIITTHFHLIGFRTEGETAWINLLRAPIMKGKKCFARNWNMKNICAIVPTAKIPTKVYPATSDGI